MAAAAATTAPGAGIPSGAGRGAVAARGPRIPARWMPVLILGIALLFPFIEQALGLGLMNPMLRILTSVMLALGLNIVVGFAGLLDLGYVAFWAIGAYCVGWFASGHFSTTTVHLFSGVAPTLPGIHVSIWLLFIVAAGVTAFFGIVLGAPTLRLRGDYLAIVTLGFGEIIPKVFQNGDDIAGHNLTNGTRGISGLDTPSLGGPGTDAMLGMGWGTWGPLNLLPWYYLGLALVVLCWYVSVQMQWSRLGRAWMAIREDETAAAAMGINLVATKLWAYGIGASLGGIAGVYHGARIGSIFPSSFQFYISISLLCMVIIGGMGNVWGAILGAFAIEGLNFWLLPSLTSWGQSLGLEIDFSSYNLMIFGFLLVVMMLYRPQGFLPAKARVIDFDDDDVGEVGASRAGPAPSAQLHDVQHAGHGVEHYPTALHGPQAGSHPVLEADTEAHAPAVAAALEPAGEASAAPGGAPAGSAPDHDAPTWSPRFPRFDRGTNPFERGIKPVERSPVDGAPGASND